MSENELLKRELWKDYVEKGNSFANWFTSILISNFVYLIKVGGTGKLDCSVKGSLSFSIFSLVAMFLFRAIGVYTAKKRHTLVSEGKPQDNTCVHYLEKLRTGLFYLFVGAGMIAVLISGVILWFELTKARGF